MLNPKGELQQISQLLRGRPEYTTTAETGPEHDRTFTVEVRFGDEVVGSGTGASRQLAEKAAALEALRTLRARLPRQDAADRMEAKPGPA